VSDVAAPDVQAKLDDLSGFEDDEFWDPVLEVRPGRDGLRVRKRNMHTGAIERELLVRRGQSIEVTISLSYKE
jgi:hypothetical protein